VPKDKRQVETGLLNKGFRRHEGDHSWFIYFALDGRKSLAKTKTSHGRGFDIDDGLLACMARQCGLKKSRFIELVECPLQRPEYETFLKQAGKL